jgi:hypothetical protein
LNFIHSNAGFHCFTFLVSVIGVITYNIFRKCIEIFWKKYRLALNLVEKYSGTDPNLPKVVICLIEDVLIFLRIRIRIPNTEPDRAAEFNTLSYSTGISKKDCRAYSLNSNTL